MKTTPQYEPFLPWANLPRYGIQGVSPDDRSGDIYLEDERLRLVTEVAIVARRPLLIRGEPGSGKSSYAPFAARNLNWRYYEYTVTGRTEAKDLLWRFDALARLRDAQAQVKREQMKPARYVTPGVLWWAFNRQDAIAFSATVHSRRTATATQSRITEPFAEVNRNRNPAGVVVLIDEIDKADPDVPNDLLEVMGMNRFRVEEADHEVESQLAASPGDFDPANRYGRLLIVITTNEERDLPAAFLRRCIVHTLEEPKDKESRMQRLGSIARLHMASLIENQPQGVDFVKQIAGKCEDLREEARHKQRRGPSIAEFLDAVRVCLTLGVPPTDARWQTIQQNVLLK